MPGSVIQGLFPQGLTRIAQPGGPARATPNGTAVPLPQQIAVPTHGGQPLAPEVLQRMEAAFGTNFRDVRVHVGAQPAALGALAFAHGSHVYFGPGQYDPSSDRGLRVLGHELAHVVQQRTGRVANPFGAGIAVVQNSALELEADRMAERAAAHQVQPKMAAATVQPTAPVRVSAPMKTGGNSYRIAANAGGANVGSVMVHAKDQSSILVTDLGVDPGHRKEGIGNALLASAARTGMQLGKQKVVLDSQDNGSGHLTRWYRSMGFVQTGVGPNGMPRLEAPIGRVLPAAAQAKPAPGQHAAHAARPVSLQRFPSHAPAVQPLMRPRVIQRAAPPAIAVAGKTAAQGIIKWLNSNGHGGVTNYTVGVMANDDLVISKVGGVTDKTAAMGNLAAEITKKGYEVGRDIYLAQKFTSDGTSNHAEMCLFAATGGNLTYILCTGPNCDFCGFIIKNAKIENGNAGGEAKSQIGWSHPFKPLLYGSSKASNVLQLEELKLIEAGTMEAKDTKCGTRASSDPSADKKTPWM